MSEGAAYINSPPVWVAEVVKNEPLVLGSRRSWNGRPNSPTLPVSAQTVARRLSAVGQRRG